MLTAFYQSYLLIVGVCALFCLLVNLYNFLYHVTLGKRERALHKKAEKLAEALSSRHMGEDKAGRYPRRLLRRGRNLRVFYEALDQLNWNTAEDIPEEVVQVLRQRLNGDISAYRRFSDPQRALAVTLGNRLQLRTETFQHFLTKCMERSPMYLRILALRGCALQGNEGLMLKTLETVSEEGAGYSVKMITDVLTLYPGKREELFGVLWSRFDTYSENVCCSVINVMAAEQMEAFSPQVLTILQNSGMYLECRIAAIKYLGSVRYAPAERVLAGFLFAEDWEYSAVAARALSNYDCGSAGEELLRALSARNWHVRYNSAMTLVSRRPDLVERALKHEDRYARDIMKYALNINGRGEG